MLLLDVGLKELQWMKHLQAGSFRKLDFTDTALGDDGINVGGFEQIKEGLAHGHGEFVAQQAGLQAEGAAHAAAGTGFNHLDVRAAPPQPLPCTMS